jgi:reductive dehalogenase
VVPGAVTQDIKDMISAMGAVDVGVARLNQGFVYSHVGRGPELWGQPITNSHRYVIAFSLEMDYRCVEAAPQLDITEETARIYLVGAKIAVKVAEYIRGLGYPARGHISGSNYQMMLPAVGYDTGLGELGRHGYLISPRYGSRIRLGAVTTDIPLVVDERIEFGVQDFCAECMKCADNCPVGAISKGDKENIRGVEKWQLNMETCYQYWRTLGTDCGLCMKVCPFSHPPTLVHNMVRAGIKRSSFARTVSVWGDDLFYGKRVYFQRYNHE